MTKITLFGATGKTGIPAVEQALERGWQVTAFLRTPSKLTIQHDNLTVVQGDARNPDDVAKAIHPDTDAVISALGHVKGGDPQMLLKASEAIVAAMRAQGVKKYIVMSGGAVDAEGDKPTFLGTVIGFMVRTFGKAAYEQQVWAIDYLKQQEDIQWIAPRFPRVTQEPPKGTLEVGMAGSENVGISITHADAATFLLNMVESDEHVHGLPFVSN